MKNTDLRRHHGAAGFFGAEGVLQHAQARTQFGVRHEEVPQALLARLGLELVHPGWDLPLRPVAAMALAQDLFPVLVFDGFDVRLDESTHAGGGVFGTGTGLEVHGVSFV